MQLAKTLDNFIERAKGLKVAVVGETITDKFQFVTYEGQSMKSICPVFRLSGKELVQEGGAAAIANHLRDFVKSIDLFSNSPDEIVKTRYIDNADQKKHVEINRFELKAPAVRRIEVENYDVVIVADFGHGYCDHFDISDGFHLMCQTNSNNYGFNRVSKWKTFKKKSLCIDLREASLQLNKKVQFENEEEVKEIYNYELNTQKLFITLGRKGALYYDGHKLLNQDAFDSEIVDTIGAGDTFFAFACLTSEMLKDGNILLIPSLAASLSTTWLCNEKSVNKTNLTEYVNKFI